MIKIVIEKKPAHIWHCKQCKFLKQIVLINKDEVKRHDVYRSCSSDLTDEKEDGYIIIHGPEDGNYSSSITFDTLLFNYCLNH